MFLSYWFDRLARWIYGARLWVLAAFLIVAGAALWSAKDVGGVLYGSTVEVPGTPSHHVAEMLRRDFKNDYAEIAVVTVANDTLTTRDPVYAEGLRALADSLRALPEVKAVTGDAERVHARLRSADGHLAILVVGLRAASVQESERVTPTLRAAIAPVTAGLKQQHAGFLVATTGRGALAYDVSHYGAADSEKAESRVIPLTLIILLFAFGALVAAFIPLGMGLLSTAIALGLIAVIGRYVPLGNMVQNVSTMVGLAVGIDYSLLMISRFREALARGLGTEDAVAETMRTAGVAVACSGFTVMIGLAGLGFTPSLDTRSIGLGGALVLIVGVTLALTLLPALLSILGPRIDSPRAFERFLRPLSPQPAWDRWAKWVMSFPRRLAVLGFVLLLLMCAPLLFVRTEFAGSRWIPAHALEFHTGFEVLQRMGQKNFSTPIDLLITAEQGAVLDPANLASLLALSKQVHADPRVLAVISPVDINEAMTADDYTQLYRGWQAKRSLARAQFDAFISQDGRSAIMQVIARDAESFEGIKALAADLSKAPEPDGLQVFVGGQAGFYNDLHEALRRSLPPMIAFVVIATFILLALAYRSWLVPLKATALNLLSVGAGCGALVMIFQWGWGKELIGLTTTTGGIPLSILAMIFCIVFGLSMDYEVFLISRIKEIFDETGDNAIATERGLASTGGMITSAAAIMIAVFGAFAWADLVMVKMLGVGLGVAVLVDATIVRVLLAPALMRLAGDWNWHPGARPGQRLK